MIIEECEVSTMENQEDKYANINLTKVYEYVDMPDKSLVVVITVVE
jgi:ribosomal protein L18E